LKQIRNFAGFLGTDGRLSFEIPAQNGRTEANGSQFATNDPQGVGKGQSVRIEMLVLGGFVHQGAHSEHSDDVE
jgi:hypothetical protein